MIVRLFRRKALTSPVADRIDHALRERRAARKALQATARQREANKIHAQFARDPLIRAARADHSNGAEHV